MYKPFVIWLATVFALIGSLLLGNLLLQKSVNAASVLCAGPTRIASDGVVYTTVNEMPDPNPNKAEHERLASFNSTNKLPDSGDTGDVLSQSITRTDQKDMMQEETASPLPPGRYVALTFDDGPSPYTLQILAILKRYQIRATFFVLGSQAAAHPDWIRQIHEQGHVIGNHSWNHSDLTKLSKEQLLQQVNATNQLLESLTGERPCLFRPPYGKTDPEVRSAIENAGMTAVLWNVDPADWDLKKTAPVHARVQSGLQEHSLVLLHDGGGPRQRTVDSLPVLIEHLLQQGYRFVTVPDYLHLSNNK
ncbi:polysaccharide deacetylase family protein [Effusibacillus pohliae]|uniref:polysaccharide deacetylase family protein n=1 Tax=Effusibacillus pohliae TaxID=232270 RepID=UPI000363F039|nr:polysaccharide deacetylase family protein [Effusibacillus pohliae]